MLSPHFKLILTTPTLIAKKLTSVTNKLKCDPPFHFYKLCVSEMGKMHQNFKKIFKILT